MTQPFSQFAQNNYYVNPPRWSGYSTAGEALSFSSGETDPTVTANWKSPSTNVVSDNGDLVHLFDYTINPGSVTYIGEEPIILDCLGITSAESSANNTELRFQWAKNGIPSGTRYLYQNIANGNDIISLPSMITYTLETGDYVDFFFNADKACTITIQNAEWKVRAVASDYTP